MGFLVLKFYIVVCGCIGCGFEVDFVVCYEKWIVWLFVVIELFEIGGCVVDVFMFVKIVVFDEGGEVLILVVFVRLFEGWCDSGVCEVCFLIGVVDGLMVAESVSVDKILSFGIVIWLYLMVCVMLCE